MIHAPCLPGPSATIGLARLARQVENRADLATLIETLGARLAADPEDMGALLDTSMLLQLKGKRGDGLELQAQALSRQHLFETVHGDGTGLRVLALSAPGDFTANTPIDFLLEGSNMRVITAYADPVGTSQPIVPDHDVALLAIGESPANAAMLNALIGPCAAWPRPIVNGQPERIAGLQRDAVAQTFAGEAAILAPETRRMTREQVEASDLPYPVTIRPTGTQAGAGLALLCAREDLTAYLEDYGDPAFYVADFIDYAGADGLFRKQRIVFIDRVPYISHLAVSEDWIVHYMSAGMAENALRRQEEAAFMASFDTGFARRHAAAFALLCDRIGLDYFGIDCGETRDGRLLLFEVDVAMIVHALEDGPHYAYKKAPMARLFAAFAGLLERRMAG